MKLHTCKVPRKGKGANGFQTIKSFGIPVLNTDGVATDFDYTWLVGTKLQEVIDFIESTQEFSNRAMVESFVRGCDNYLRSVTVREEIATAELCSWILEQDLAEDEKKAKDLAAIWAQTQEFQKKCNIPVFTAEDFAPERRKFVQAQKDAGVWKACLVKDTTPQVPVPNTAPLPGVDPKVLEAAIRNYIMNNPKPVEEVPADSTVETPAQ